MAGELTILGERHVDSLPRVIAPKPDLVLRPDDLTVTARDLATLIVKSARVFDSAGPVQVLKNPDGSPRVVQLDADGIVILSHDLARPVLLNSDGAPTAKTLPRRVAQLYLALDDWGLPPLKGITTAALLLPDGSFRGVDGYDAPSGLWCANIPPLKVTERPSEVDARVALTAIRETFRTFPFADAIMVLGGSVPRVNTAAPPKHDESAFLCALMTAICRRSLPLAPGLLITAPFVSGAGTGKGQLVRAISAIAFGMQPPAFTTGPDSAELDKRIASALIQGAQVVFIDNVNTTTLRSDLLASILTERYVEVRPLGHSRMCLLCPSTFVAITGNGLKISEDLARRFLIVQLDAHTSDPETRPFAPGFLNSIVARRRELLTAVLTIWRWGRQNENALKHGRPLGGFEEWCLWVRDPLLTLGCADPVERITVIKKEDPIRRGISELFAEWWKCHEARPVKVVNLKPTVVVLIDPQGRGRQFVASELSRLEGTSVDGLQLSAQRGSGKWSAITYALRRVAGAIDNAP
jgi:hypothetical protein